MTISKNFSKNLAKSQETVLFRARQHSSTRSRAPAWVRTLWKLCSPVPACDQRTVSVLGAYGVVCPAVHVLIPLRIEHAIAGISKSRHDEFVIIQYGIDGRYKNLDLGKLMLKLLDPLLGS